jgi:hypothetical protein
MSIFKKFTDLFSKNCYHKFLTLYNDFLCDWLRSESGNYRFPRVEKNRKNDVLPVNFGVFLLEF